MIQDPLERGRSLAVFCAEVSPRLYEELEASGELPSECAEDDAKAEWECFALYACVRGLVAAGGFNRETAGAIDSFHEAVLASWTLDDAARFDARRARIAERYAEYGAIGQAGGASGAATVARRLGAAFVAHLGGDASDESFAEFAGGLHETLAEGAAEAVRIAQ